MKKIIALFCLFFLLSTAAQAEVFVDQTPPADWESRDLLRITVFRTGESDCMLLEAGGEAMMMDGGANPWREKLRDALNARNITHFKYMYSTHPHDDHIDGLYRLLQYGFTADEFVSVFAKDFKNDLHQRTVKEVDKAGISYRQLQTGDVITLGDAALTVYRWNEGKSINELSPMTKLVYKNATVLFTADITGLAQRYFMAELDPEIIQADVAKFPHHGLTPFVTEFLDVVDPDFLFATNNNNDDVRKAKNQIANRKLPAKFSGAGTIIMETDGTDWYISQTLKQF